MAGLLREQLDTVPSAPGSTFMIQHREDNDAEEILKKVRYDGRNEAPPPDVDNSENQPQETTGHHADRSLIAATEWEDH
jgi:hypothetical protein